IHSPRIQTGCGFSACAATRIHIGSRAPSQARMSASGQRVFQRGRLWQRRTNQRRPGGVEMSYREVSEIRDGMRIDWDMPIEMDDGVVLRCDIFRPVKEGRYPVIMTLGPYAKWLHFEDGYKTAWKRMQDKQPDVMTG